MSNRTRRLSQLIETVHAVTYFAPESMSAAKDVGFKGFWMGYFGFRASPLGMPNAATVGALFFGFADRMVQRAIPDAWDYGSPDDALASRASSAATVLRRCAPSFSDDAAARLADDLRALAKDVRSEGRALGAANMSVDPPSDPVERLWQECTTLRELRGDAHIAALVNAGIGGCAAHVITAAHDGLASRMPKPPRGWFDEEWDDAAQQLRADGWLAEDGTVTLSGREIRTAVEEATDRLAFAAGAQLEPVTTAIEPLAVAIAAAGDIDYPNPIGLPRVAAE